jgi:bacterioferritin
MNTKTHMPVAETMSQTAAAGAGGGQGLTVYLGSEPYPTVEKGSDPETVRMLKEDYAGAVSELTAVTQYLYQNVLSADNESFANAILQIAIAEMSHMDMLGDAILALGGNPAFGNGTTYWHGKHVNYARTLPEMLSADIAAETQAIANYERHAERARNASVRALLERIVKDEKLHLRFFRETLAGLQGQPSLARNAPSDQAAMAAADPQLELTAADLAAFDGKNGQPAYIANDGIIYDVTNSPAWKEGAHADYRAGKDLTADFLRADHGESVLVGIPVVGKLVS